MTHALEARGVEVRAGGRTILDVPSLEVEEGETLALLGPNGAGKTTLINVLSLLVRPARGEVMVKGIRPGRDPVPLRRRMAVVFQKPHLLSTSVVNNVAAGLAFRGAKDFGARVESEMRRLGILHLKDRHASGLSGGEAARVSLARALVLDPEILMLDEPFSALDSPTRMSLMADLEGILGRAGATTVMSTHDVSEALRLANRIAVIVDGRIVQIGPAAEVKDRPCSADVARLVGTENVLEGMVASRSGEDAVISIAGVTIRARTSIAVGESVLCMIRPEHVRLAARRDGSGQLQGTIARVVPSAHHACIHVDCGFGLSAAAVSVPPGMSPGSTVAADVDPERVHVIHALCHG